MRKAAKRPNLAVFLCVGAFYARIGKIYERIRCSNARMFLNAWMLEFIARIREIYERIQQSNARVFFYVRMLEFIARIEKIYM